MALTTHKTVEVGFIDTNCHVVGTASGSLYVIDPGGEDDKILRLLSTSFKDYSPKAVLLTHAHIDHIGAAKQIAQALGVSIHLHPADRGLYFSPQNAIVPYLPAVLEPMEPLYEFPVGDFEALHVPGHTQGGMAFLFKDDSGADFVMSGDTLFRESVGRTDLPGGDSAAIVKSIQTLLARLKDDAEIHPGHGPSTTAGHERARNPFLPRGMLGVK